MYNLSIFNYLFDTGGLYLTHQNLIQKKRIGRSRPIPLAL
jgi:hypothetical protein